jgi:glycosyltransferase involved in cell wall biosynthesis
VETRLWWRKQRQASLERILSRRQVDLIHMHGLDFYEYKLPGNVPVLVTLHLPVSWYPKEIWGRYAGMVRFQCVSETQRLSCPAELRDAPVILNGVAPPASLEKKSDYAMTLGRICPEKNQHEALEAGYLAGVRVLVGGQVFPYQDHRTYFYKEVMPLLRQHGPMVQHEFLGPLAPLRKQELLARARCLLHPTLAPETSSLVAMEALAAGTPVIAYPSGALTEIVDEGVTGFLVRNVEEMAAAIARVREIRPENCRAAARERFSREQMIQGYFQLYAEMTRGRVPERQYA